MYILKYLTLKIRFFFTKPIMFQIVESPMEKYLSNH